MRMTSAISEIPSVDDVVVLAEHGVPRGVLAAVVLAVGRCVRYAAAAATCGRRPVGGVVGGVELGQNLPRAAARRDALPGSAGDVDLHPLRRVDVGVPD